MYSRLKNLCFVIGALVLIVVQFLLAPTPVQAGGVVGTGTAASCTNQALIAALENGGIVTFNCGSEPVTIPITETLNFQSWNTTIDGANQITLQGTPGVRIIYFRTWGFNAARTVTLRNLTITGASRTGVREEANGPAIYVHNQSANFDSEPPTLTVENVTFTNNTLQQTSPQEHSYDYGGGAIYILGGILNVSNSTFSGNRADGASGGAIHGLGSNINISSSTFTNNTATEVQPGDIHGGYGGALYVDGAFFGGGGSIVISGSTFDGNTADNQGGFAYVNLYPGRDNMLSVDRSVFSNNTVLGGSLGWGGAFSGGGTGSAVTMVFTNSTFYNNRATSDTQGGDGGALAFAQAANVTIANSTFYQNEAVNTGGDSPRGRGGAVFVSNSGSYQIINSTLVGNTAGWMGGALIGQNGTLTNTIIANNIALDKGGSNPDRQQCVNTLNNGGGNIQFPGMESNDDRICAAGITIADPQLDAFSNGVLPLQATSPAIDAGVNSVCQSYPVNGIDQLGRPRDADGDGNGSAVCDSGAYETNHNTDISDLQVTGLNTAPVRPTLSWTHQTSGAANVPGSWYNVLITTVGGAKVADAWYEAGDICSGVTCSVQVGGSVLPYGDANVLPFGLINGTYTWKVTAYISTNNLPHAFGTAFTVDLPQAEAPSGVVDVSTGRPILTVPNDPNTTWFNIWIGTPDFRQTVHYAWFSKEDAACDATNCTIIPNAHPTNGRYVLYMQTWGPGGFNGGDPNAWVEMDSFEMNFDPAPLITPLTTTVTNGQPTFTWNGSSGTTWYQLWVGTDSPDYSTRHLQWYAAVDLGCNGGGVCSVTPADLTLNTGESYSWWVQAWGPGGTTTAGEAGWQEGGTFTP
ncbi:MAG: hypothetical protein OHK0046_00400 [Anaerolineae bacterium]